MSFSCIVTSRCVSLSHATTTDPVFPALRPQVWVERVSAELMRYFREPTPAWVHKPRESRGRRPERTLSSSERDRGGEGDVDRAGEVSREEERGGEPMAYAQGAIWSRRNIIHLYVFYYSRGRNLSVSKRATPGGFRSKASRCRPITKSPPSTLSRVPYYESSITYTLVQ